MADRDDDGHPACDMFKAEPREQRTFVVRDQELFREIGKDADAIRALVDQAIEDAAHPFGVERAIVMEGGRRDGPDSGVFGHGAT